MSKIWRRHRKLKMFDKDYIICHVWGEKIDIYRNFYYETFVCTVHPTNPIEVQELSFKSKTRTEMYREIILKLSEYSKGDFQIGDDID